MTAHPREPTEGKTPVCVRHWMSPDPVTVTPRTSVADARRLLRGQRVRHLPVVTIDGRVVGMVSDRDLLMRDTQVVQALSALQSDLVWGRYRRVETVMSAPVQFVAPAESVGQAARTMLSWQISCLPVIDRGRLVGIITTSDCLRALSTYEADRVSASGTAAAPALPIP